MGRMRSSRSRTRHRSSPDARASLVRRGHGPVPDMVGSLAGTGMQQNEHHPRGVQMRKYGAIIRTGGVREEAVRPASQGANHGQAHRSPWNGAFPGSLAGWPGCRGRAQPRGGAIAMPETRDRKASPAQACNDMYLILSGANDRSAHYSVAPLRGCRPAGTLGATLTETSLPSSRRVVFSACGCRP